MGGMRPLLAAALAALATPAAADCPEGEFRFAPAYVGTFKSYGFSAAFVDPIDHARAATAKTGKLCVDCEVPGRGVLLAPKTTPERNYGGGFFQAPVPVGDVFCASARLDLSALAGPGAFVGVEFDSPALPIDQSPESYVFVGVEDLEGVRSVWVEVSGAGVGAPLALADGTTQLALELEYAGGSFDVRVRPEGAEAWSPVVADQPFEYAGSGALGVGAFNLVAGDRPGVALTASGALFAPALQDVLAALAALHDLAAGAGDDLAASNAVDARAKLEESLAMIDPTLAAQIGALPESKTRAFALKQLAKAAAKLGQALAKIDAETPAIESARSLVRKVDLAARRARRVLETGSTAEAKRVGPS